MFRLLRHSQFLRVPVGVAVLMGLLLALFLAASPRSHERLHHSAGTASHECLVTVLHAGGFEDIAAPSTFTAFLASLFEPAAVDRSAVVESVFLTASVLEHAPPVGFLS